MADRFVLSQLKRQPLFARLNPDQLEQVAGVTQVLRLNPGQVLFQQGQHAYGMAMFVSGEGQLSQFNPQTNMEAAIGVVRSGEYVNQDALFTNLVSPVTLRVMAEAVVLSISRAHIATLLSYYPEIRAAMQPGIVQAPRQPGDAAPAFKAQRENETPLLEVHLHWWSFLVRAWLWMLLMVLALIAVLVLPLFLPGIPSPLLAIPFLVLGILGTVYFYLEWRNDKLIITGERVIFEHRSIIQFKVLRNEIPIEGIHEINVDVPMTDFAARLLRYGTLVVKTTGDADNLVLRHVPNPKTVQDAIFGARKKQQANKLDEERKSRLNAIRGDLDRALGAEAQMEPPKPTPDQKESTERGWLSIKFFDEHGNTVYRHHRVVWFSHIIWPLLLLVGSVTLFAISTFNLMGQFTLGLVGDAAAIIFTVIALLWFYWADWDWRNDMYIVGDDKITLIHKRPLWLQDRTEQVLLSQVDNVVSETAGPINTFLQLGDIKLLLSGSDEKSAKHFRSVYRPDDIQEDISRRQARAGDAAREADASRQRQAIVDYLKVYHEAQGTPLGSNAFSQGYADSLPPADPTMGPRSRDRVRPPGIPLVRRDPPTGG
jgi:hypothetical protein